MEKEISRRERERDYAALSAVPLSAAACRGPVAPRLLLLLCQCPHPGPAPPTARPPGLPHRTTRRHARLARPRHRPPPLLPSVTPLTHPPPSFSHPSLTHSF